MKDTLHYEIIGDATQPALLMVHGMLSSNFQWEDNKVCCRERLTEVACPTLLCQGIYEKQFREPATYAKTQIPNITVVEMEAGHNPNRDAAEHFNQAVLNFLKPTLVTMK